MKKGTANEPEQQEKPRCPMCRRLIEGVPKHLLAGAELRILGDSKTVKLTFDKKECAIVFERLRRYYGDEYFVGLGQ